MAIVNYRARLTRVFSLAITAGVLASCNRDRVLTITDPDVINPSNLASAEAAEALRVGAISRLTDVTAGLIPQGGSLGEGVFQFGGALVDEWRSTDTFVQRDQTDQRAIDGTNSAMTLIARSLNRTRVAAIQAIPVLKQYKPLSISDVGQMFWIRGWAEMSIAETFCNGSPISSLDASNAIQYGEPETNLKIYERALASFDTATQNAPAGDARADTVKWLSAITKARVMLDLGQFANAGTTVTAANIPDNFKFSTSYSQPTTDNQIWALNNSAGRWMPADNEGPLGLNIRTANDPRVPICIGGQGTATTAYPNSCKAFDPNQTRATGFDNLTGSGNFLVQLVWPTRESDVAIVMATEAHLIRAEAALRGGDPVEFMARLNFLRANSDLFKQPATPCRATVQVAGCPAVPAGGTLLPPLTDPGTQTGREDLLFRERGFWLWSTGHRLPDLRRLVRPLAEGGFGRAESSVYPTGAYYKGGVFGSNKSLVIPTAEENNPQFHGCLDLNP